MSFVCYSLQDLKNQPSDSKSLSLYCKDADTASIFAELLRFAPSLEELEICYDEFSALPDEIAHFQQLRQLKFRAYNLVSLSPEIGKLQHLESLDISHQNKLAALPDSLGQLKQLKQFGLGASCFEKLPDVIGELTGLEELNIGAPHLQKPFASPMWLSQLINLKKLVMNGLGLTHLPDVFDKLPNLEELLINNNDITELPPSIASLQKLTSFYAWRCPFGRVPEPLLACRALTDLQLSSCRLESLPEDIAKLQELTVLYLPYNKISSLPTSILQLKKLYSLNLASNSIQNLPAPFTFPLLTFFNIDHNSVQDLDSVMGELPAFQYVSFKYNPIKGAPLFFLDWNFTRLDTLRNRLTIERNNPFFKPKTYDLIDPLLHFFSINNIPKTQRKSLYYLLTGVKKEQLAQPLAAVLYAFCSDGSLVELLQNANKWIEAQYAKALKTKPLAKGAKLALIGTLSFDEQAIAQQLEPLGIDICAVDDTQLSHVVLGQSISLEQAAALAQKSDIVLLSAQQLADFLAANNQLFLVEKDQTPNDSAQNLEHLRGLLHSQDIENKLLAIEMLANGGVPAELMTDLYALYALQLHPGNHERNTAFVEALMRILQTYAPKKILTLPKISLYKAPTKAEWERVWNACRAGLIDWQILEPILINYAVDFIQPHLEKLSENLDGAGLSKALEAHIERNEGRIRMKDIPYPKLTLLLPFADKIKSIDATGVAWDKLPDIVFSFKNLEDLNISCTAIYALPDALAQLSQLNKLNIYNTKIKTFPAVFYQMPALMRISCMGTPFAEALAKQKTHSVDTNIFDLSDLPHRISRK